MVTVEHIEEKKASLEKTKILIEKYLTKQFNKKKQVYPSDVADALGLRYETVREVFADLEKEGKVQESR
jgi:predicted ArsR family transcriptional regulator